MGPPNLPRRRPPPSPRRLPQRSLLPKRPQQRRLLPNPRKLPQRRPRSKCFIWLTTSNDHFKLIVGKPALFRATNFPIKNFENAIRNIKIVNGYYMILFRSNRLKFL